MGVSASSSPEFQETPNVDSDTRDKLLLHIGTSGPLRKVKVLPRACPLYNITLPSSTNKNIRHTILQAPPNSIFALFGNGEMDLVSIVQDGALLTPLQVHALITTTAANNYIISNVTSYASPRDNELIDGIDNKLTWEPSNTIQHRPWQTMARSIDFN